MDRKLLSVFFSALICSTLAHEYLKAHEISHAARLNSKNHHDDKDNVDGAKFRNANHKAKHNGASARLNSNNHNDHNVRNNWAPPLNNNGNDNSNNNLGAARFRDSSEDCSYTCPVPAPPDYGNGEYLRLLTIIEINAFAILNDTAHVGVIFDINSALIVDGISGIMIWLDLQTETGLHFRAESNVGWIREQGTLLEYLLKLGVLSNVQNLKGGNKFNIKTAPHHISVEASIILKLLAVSLTVKLDKNPKASLSIFVVLTKTLAEQKETVQLIFQKLETRKVIISGELTTIASTLIGLGLLNKRLQGNLKILITKQFSTSLLLDQRSGLEIFTSLLVQVGDTVDVSKVLGNILKSPEALLEVLVELDGGFYRGVAGIIAVIHNIQLYVAKKISLEALVDILIQVGAENNEKITKERWLTIVNAFLGVIKVQTEKYSSGGSLSAVANFFNDIKDDKLSIGGIDVSAIINILIEKSGETGQGSLVVVIKILLLLEVVVSVTLILAVLVLRLIWFVISGEGIIFILKLLPKVKIEIDFSSTTSIIKQILSKFSLVKITLAIARLDVVAVISAIPVIGDIFQSVEVALKESGNRKINLGASLKESGAVIGVIKDWVWFGLGLGGKQPSGGGIAGSSFIGGGVHTSWTATYTSTVTWTQSGQSLVSGSGSGGSASVATTKASGSDGWGWTWSWGKNSGAAGTASGSGSGSGGSSGSGSGGSSGGGSGSGGSGGSGSFGGSGNGGSSGGGSGSGGASGSKGSSGSSGWSWNWGSNSGSSGSSSSGGSGGNSGSGSGGASGGSSGSGSGGAFGGGSGSGSGGASGGSSGSASGGAKGSGSGGAKGGTGLSWGWGWGR